MTGSGLQRRGGAPEELTGSGLQRGGGAPEELGGGRLQRRWLSISDQEWVEEGIDFMLDSQVGGGDQFSFVPELIPDSKEPPELAGREEFGGGALGLGGFEVLPIVEEQPGVEKLVAAEEMDVVDDLAVVEEQHVVEGQPVVEKQAGEEEHPGEEALAVVDDFVGVEEHAAVDELGGVEEQAVVEELGGVEELAVGKQEDDQYAGVNIGCHSQEIEDTMMWQSIC